MDINGKEYLDCSSSYGVALLGHCHPKVIGLFALKLNNSLPATEPTITINERNSSRKLIKITPKALPSFLSNSGADP
jgi:acetylornithine/succinyldiaminopimelate/putrescine aminotransferase